MWRQLRRSAVNRLDCIRLTVDVLVLLVVLFVVSGSVPVARMVQWLAKVGAARHCGANAVGGCWGLLAMSTDAVERNRLIGHGCKTKAGATNTVLH